ncbi:MAG: hypothetical protein FJ202_10640, partial [Gemmatimonadetes bacterium]|nr:hypothetical protein [Gemmatimonadota bacterium]
MLIALALPAAFALQAQVTIGAGAKRDSLRIREARTEAVFEEVRDDTSRRRPPRRVPVTDAHFANAYRDPAAKDLLTRARIARMRQDSTLTNYDAKAYERVSVGLGFKALGRERLAFRHESASRIRWSRKSGAWVEVTGSRSVAPVADDESSNSGSPLAPIPYYPGRDNLWVGSGLARAEVDEEDLVHPIATGAEAYYTYATGDSVTMTLPDGDTIVLRELLIAARNPKWNVAVGSFWFDVRTAQLVRAVYRLSTPLDIWAAAREESARERADTSRRDRGNDDGPPIWAKPFLSPMKADISGITIEYGLYNQRFWLPRTQAIEGYAQVSFMRVPITFEQRFRYETVNGSDSVPPIPVPARSPVLVLRDSLRKAGVDSVVRDSLLRIARRERAEQLARDRESQCQATGLRTTYRRQYEGSLTIAMQVPCDSAKLANSPDLPPSIYDANEAVFGGAERAALMKALDFGLQPGWGPQRPTIEWGLAHTRYNRVEGFSTGATITSALGLGYTASAGIRGSWADRQVNGELGVARTNGRSVYRVSAFRRLVASDDWGNPLSFGASTAALLYARDEGAYYRAMGAELLRAPASGRGLEWRLFAERQRGDSVHSRWTLFKGGNDDRFIANPLAAPLTQFGGSLRIRPQWGLNPDGTRLFTDLRVEAAAGDSTYARVIGDMTVTTALPFATTALTLSAGGSAGGLPTQRRFFLGGLQSVRGQTALAARGNAFWLARGEIGTRNTDARYTVFGDIGWAGSRA